jgi:hypothetical protein
MGPAELRVEVVYCPGPGVTDLDALLLPPGATVADALKASALPGRHGLQVDELRLGIWGKPRPPETALRDRDRVEIYRPLKVDPKEARRQRYRQHREKTARR